jgi:hypothetical protein
MNLKKGLDMKKFISTIIITLALCSIVFAGEDEIRYKVTQNAVVITASSSDTSERIDFGTKVPVGFFSVQVTLTGSGTGKVEYELSNDGTNFLTPTEADDIVTAHTVTSGPGSDGKDMYSFSPMVSRAMKIKVTETGGANPITVTVTLVYQ